MNKESSKKKNTIILLSVIVILLILVFTHPWVQFIAEQEIRKTSPSFHVVLTDWSPFGNSFDIRWHSPITGYWSTFGKGFVDIFGRVEVHDFNDGLAVNETEM